MVPLMLSTFADTLTFIEQDRRRAVTGVLALAEAGPPGVS